MSTFWSGWVMLLAALNLGIAFFLFIWGQVLKIPTQQDGTTGHVWAHGVLRESVRKLPLWWVLLSIVVFILGVGYFALYPGFGNAKGVLAWTSSLELQRDTAANNAKMNTVLQAVHDASLETLAGNAAVTATGQVLFADNCAGCHGSQAQGNQTLGAPNLTDADSLYGQSSEALLASIADGRNGVMPAWGAVLGQAGLNEVTSYVVSLSGRKAPADWIKAGKLRYDTLCFACHGANAEGSAALGAPNLTDEVWLYGDDYSRIVESIRDGRNGVMPAWSKRLTSDQMRMIAAWVLENARRRAIAPRAAH